MTTDELLASVNDRGLSLVLKPDGTLALRGPKAAVTDRLLAVLRWHKDAIHDRLGNTATIKAVDVVVAPIEPPTPWPLDPPADDPWWQELPVCEPRAWGWGRHQSYGRCGGYVRLARWEDQPCGLPTCYRNWSGWTSNAASGPTGDSGISDTETG